MGLRLRSLSETLTEIDALFFCVGHRSSKASRKKLRVKIGPGSWKDATPHEKSGNSDLDASFSLWIKLENFLFAWIARQRFFAFVCSCEFWSFLPQSGTSTPIRAKFGGAYNLPCLQPKWDQTARRRDRCSRPKATERRKIKKKRGRKLKCKYRAIGLLLIIIYYEFFLFCRKVSISVFSLYHTYQAQVQGVNAWTPRNECWVLRRTAAPCTERYCFALWIKWLNAYYNTRDASHVTGDGNTKKGNWSCGWVTTFRAVTQSGGYHRNNISCGDTKWRSVRRDAFICWKTVQNRTSPVVKATYIISCSEKHHERADHHQRFICAVTTVTRVNVRFSCVTHKPWFQLWGNVSYIPVRYSYWYPVVLNLEKRNEEWPSRVLTCLKYVQSKKCLLFFCAFFWAKESPHGRSATIFSELLTWAQYLTGNMTSTKIVRATRPTLLRPCTKTIIILVKWW